MALVESVLANSVNNGTDATSYAGSSTTPAAGSLLVEFAIVNKTDGVPTTPTVSAWGLTWTLVDSILYDGVTQGKLFCWVAGPATGTASGITLDFGGVTQHGINMWGIAFAGAATTNNGQDGIAQHVTNSGSGTAMSVTLGNSPLHTDNRPLVRYGFGAATTVTPEAAWLEFADANHANPNTGGETQYRDNGGGWDNTSTGTLAATAAWGAIALEISVVAPGGGGATVSDPFGMTGFFGG